MTTSELLELDIDSLEKAKFEAVKKECIKKLELIINLIKNNEFKQVFEYLEDSPSGDGYGQENQYISFDEIYPKIDIGEVVRILSKLNNRINGKEGGNW